MELCVVIISCICHCFTLASKKGHFKRSVTQIPMPIRYLEVILSSFFLVLVHPTGSCMVNYILVEASLPFRERHKHK